MTDQYLHGAQVIEIDSGPRPIRTVQSGIIGVVGTAPGADSDKFPLNVPVLIAGSRRESAKLGNDGTLPQALDGIFDQAGAVVIVIRVEEDVDPQKTQSNIIGGVDETTEQLKGIEALLGAESEVKFPPKILIAPAFSSQKAVADALISVADKLRGYAILDGPNTTNAAAIAYREKFGSRRCEVVDPWYKVFDVVSSSYIVQPPSARHAGVMSRVHNTLGFWWSNSNQIIYGIDALCRPIDFTLDDTTCRANLLNSKEVTTTIRQNGFRVWGDRTCSADSKWVFKNVVITNDMIADSLVKNHLWAVDRNITKTYVEDVTEGVNNYLAYLTSIGAIAGGRCWVDKEINSPSEIQQGKIKFDYDFSAFAPAEHLTFRAQMVNGYLKEVI
ncbi:phage tail sheath protein [Zooshikella sp. RANM57]|uniref:phage tail sheath protein n=1 Tax=Zooshikella sp. RANM57 TaxID=3425863 RepID=UPI003D6ECED5